MEETINIMFIAHKRYIKPMTTFLYSLFAHNKTAMNLYLFYSDLEAVFLDKLHKFCKHWENKNLIPIKMDLSKVKNLYCTDNFPVELYYKLLCVDFLPRNLSKVLCMDLDMVVNRPLNNLYNMNLDEYPLAACEDVYGYIFGEGARNHQRLGIDVKYRYFNGGMLFLNLDYLRNFGGGNSLIEYAFENKDILKWPEQDVLNHFFVDKYLKLNWYEYNCVPVKYVMKIEDVEKGIYMPLYRDEIQVMDSFEGYADYTQAICDNASIIHYIGETKPWNIDRPQADTYKTFDRYYVEYSLEVMKILLD